MEMPVMLSSTIHSPETARDLEAALRARLHGRLRNLRVLIRSTGVVLQGTASSWYVKQLAQHELMTLSSLPIVANEIEVNRPAF
jgi:hypothetical protein